jgi:hypothetical protein
LPGTPARGASPSARRPAMPRPARGRARTAPLASETTCSASRTTRRHASTTIVPDASSASTSSSRRSRSEPRAMRRAAGVLRTSDALSTSAVSAGIRAARAARPARASAARAAFVRRRRSAIPAPTSSCAALDAGGRAA